jgi:hypothetical protein
VHKRGSVGVSRVEIYDGGGIVLQESEFTSSFQRLLKQEQIVAPIKNFSPRILSKGISESISKDDTVLNL